ncbi:MAG: S8 family peptidase, partial [Eubacteriales bacterium]
QEAVTYIEKPKRLFFHASTTLQTSCILSLTLPPMSLTGKGILIAIIDSGIRYTHEDFRNFDGTTRILSIWDQSIIPTPLNGFTPPSGYTTGSEFTQTTINDALSASTTQEQLRLLPSNDNTGHGTAVALIAAGNGRTNPNLIGVAPESDLLVVKLGNPSNSDFPLTTQLMRALSYVSTFALDRNQPLVINLSLGNTYGDHQGTSLLERYLDTISEIGKTSICVGSGNEASSGGHTSGQLLPAKTTTSTLAISPYTTSLNVQLWKHYIDTFSLQITAPSGAYHTFPISQIETLRIDLDNVELLIYIGLPTPYSISQEIFIDFLPTNVYLAQGIWSFTLLPSRIVNGRYDFYLPSSGVRNTDTRFYSPDPVKTLTIPSTATKVITVGAYDPVLDSYAFFSGRGNDQSPLLPKPDLVAPGVAIEVPTSTLSTTTYSGTSFATPYVTGSCALLMEWGILRKNDPYLYGEKMKAYLQKGAKTLRSFTEYPNTQVGYGSLCLNQSFPL